jgi:hypothetical protein
MTGGVMPAPKKDAARCTRFDSCSAPICPLDPNWPRARHLPGERVCGLIRELVKGGGEARLRARVPGELVDTLTDVLPKLSTRWERIRRELERASRSGSKLESGQRLRNPRNWLSAGVRPAPLPLASGEADTHGTHMCIGPSGGIREASA